MPGPVLTTDGILSALQPMQSAAQLSVYDSALTLVPQLGQTTTATVPLSQSPQPENSSTVAAPGSAGRRRQRRLLHSQAALQVRVTEITYSSLTRVH